MFFDPLFRLTILRMWSCCVETTSQELWLSTLHSAQKSYRSSTQMRKSMKNSSNVSRLCPSVQMSTVTTFACMEVSHLSWDTRVTSIMSIETRSLLLRVSFAIFFGLIRWMIVTRARCDSVPTHNVNVPSNLAWTLLKRFYALTTLSRLSELIKSRSMAIKCIDGVVTKRSHLLSLSLARQTIAESTTTKVL